MKINDGKPLLDSVMIDGSEFSLEKNIEWTSKMVLTNIRYFIFKKIIILPIVGTFGT